MKIIITLEKEPIRLHDDGSISFSAKASIDADGSGGNVWNEPIPPWQNDTSYHYNGQALNPNKVPFIVLPPKVILGVDPVVLGCRVKVYNIIKDIWVDAMVGDVGPATKIGEVSVECAKRLKIPPSPISGGVDDHIIFYRVWPGQKAIIDGKTYPLQPYKS